MDNQEIIRKLKIAFNWEDFDFLHLAFRYGKNYDGVGFIQDKLKIFKINLPGNFASSYALSKGLADMINEDSLTSFIKFTFHCFCLISNQIVDRIANGKPKKGNKRLKEQILMKSGKYWYMQTLKHLFIDIKLLSADFEFSNPRFLLKTKLD